MKLGDLLADASRRLAAAGIESARLDARLLIARATSGEPGDALLYPEREIDAATAADLDALVARRAAREPMSQILGQRGFRRIEVAVTRDVLSPRPETETLVEAVQAHAAKPVSRILDLGTGSGCLILALLDELPNARGVAIDISDAALDVARANAAALGLADRVAFHAGNWFDALSDDGGTAAPFDVVVSNPPYIARADIESLDPDVRDHEPRAALDGGADGLDAYREICTSALEYVTPGGSLCFEVGAGQAGAVADLMAANGFGECRVVEDLAGIERVVTARRPNG